MLFLSFAMVSVATLESVTSEAMKPLLPALSKALIWWKFALIPTLLGVPPVKEIFWQKLWWYRLIRWAKVALMWVAVVLIFVGIGYFIAAS